MNKTFCDKCKVEIYGEKFEIGLKGPIAIPNPIKDLCNTCFHKLWEFLKTVD